MQEILEVCSTSEYLIHDEGVFVSLDSDNDGMYDHNLNCMWILEAGDSQMVKLHVLGMDIEEDNTCSLDFLEVGIYLFVFLSHNKSYEPINYLFT